MQAGLLVNHIAPLKLGEIVRPLLAARYGVPLAQAATTTAVARFLDLAVLLTIAAVVGSALSLSGATPGMQPDAWLPRLTLPAAVLLGCGVGLLIRQRRVHDWLPSVLASRIDVFREQLQQVSVRRVALGALRTLPGWMLESAIILGAAHALGIHLSIPTALAMASFTILFQVFHVTPGGIGVYEGVMTGALYAHGVPWQEGLTLPSTSSG